MRLALGIGTALLLTSAAVAAPNWGSAGQLPQANLPAGPRTNAPATNIPPPPSLSCSVVPYMGTSQFGPYVAVTNNGPVLPKFTDIAVTVGTGSSATSFPFMIPVPWPGQSFTGTITISGRLAWKPLPENFQTVNAQMNGQALPTCSAIAR